MITFETVTSIDDTEFQSLFDDSVADLDAGAYPWSLFPNVTTNTQKRDHLRATFNDLLTNGIVWRVYDDDGVLMLNAGKKSGSSITWLVGLVGQDANGSKSYLYSSDYTTARNAYWTSISITGWTLETAGENTPVHNHIKSRETANAIGTVSTATRNLSDFINVFDVTVS